MQGMIIARDRLASRVANPTGQRLTAPNLFSEEWLFATSLNLHLPYVSLSVQKLDLVSKPVLHDASTTQWKSKSPKAC